MSPEEPSPSRRRLLGAAAAVAVVGASELVSACGSTSRLHVSTIPKPAEQTDAEQLNHALDLKQYLVGAYTAATPLLRGREHAAAKHFLGQDLAHVSQLMSLIKRAGGTPNPPQSSFDLGHPGGPRGILRLLDKAENAAIAGFVEVIPNVAPGSVRATLSSIVSADAQHVAVLRLALHRNPLPSAFVTGHE